MNSRGSIPGLYGTYMGGSSALLPSAAALTPRSMAYQVNGGPPLSMQQQMMPSSRNPMQTMQGGTMQMQTTQGGPMQTVPAGSMQMMQGGRSMQTMQSNPVQMMPSFNTPMSGRQMMPVSGQMGSSGPPPPSSYGPGAAPAMVPQSSGLWMPKVSYNLLEGPHEEEKEGEKPSTRDRESLMRMVAQQDQQIQDLKAKSIQLRSKHHGNHDDWVKRVEDLEAHVLSAKLKPVSDGRDLLPPEPPLPRDVVPNGLLQEYADRVTAGEVIEEECEEEGFSLEERNEQMALEKKSAELGFPPLSEMDLEEGAKIIDIRLVEPNHIEEYMRVERKKLRQEQLGKGPPVMEPPTLQGRIVDSNYALTPSQYHPVGQFTQMGLLDNLYPIDRAPMSYENVFEATWPGAEEKWYSAYADYYDSRRFSPQMLRQGAWEMDADRGKPVYNMQWSTSPAGDPMAAVGVDVTGDGFADVVVVGKDRNRDGIPDYMQTPPAVRLAQDMCSKIFPY